MGKPAAVVAVPKTPKATEPAATKAVADAQPEASDSVSPDVTEDSDAQGLLTATQMRAFVETPTASERLALLSSALHVTHYEANPRSLVWVDFCFGVLTFALEEADFSEAKALALLRLANEVFGFATSPVIAGGAVDEANGTQPPVLPSTEAVYDVFRQLVRANSVAGTASSSEMPPVWDASDVARVVAFMSSTFFRHMAAYQYVFQVPRQSLEREVALVVESPVPPQPLAAALSQERNESNCGGEIKRGANYTVYAWG
jgi:hypothetical protein